MEQEPTLGVPAAQTCPECGGAMTEENLGKLTRFRCRIGHVMTAEVLAAAQLEVIEGNLSRVLRLLNERSAMCRNIAAKHLSSGESHAAELWQRAAD
jgi:two-component system chemotaxis response regulator CheB